MLPLLAISLLLAAHQSKPVVRAPQASAEGRTCPDLRADIDEELFTFCGDEAKSVKIETIAQRFAPILWFSPNEPLLWLDPKEVTASHGGGTVCNLGGAQLPNIQIPNALPLDPRPAKSPVVYYQIIQYRGSGKDTPDDRKAVQSDRVDLEKLQQIDLRYFFYYRCDIGANPHPDDLEGAEMRLEVARIKDSPGGACRRLQLAQITGLAHGLEWVFNRLKVASVNRQFAPDRSASSVDEIKPQVADLLLPATLLVEEGKHATSPDRNGDGVFTPGYDVNYLVGEAWGVRDNFGSGLIVAKYAAEDTKVRFPRERVFPSASGKTALLRDYYNRCSSHVEPWVRKPTDPRDADDSQGSEPGTASASYELRPTPLDPEVHAKDLGDGFGQDAHPRKLWHDAVDYIGHRFALTARWDEPSSQVFGKRWLKLPDQLAWTLPGAHLGPLPVWLAPRLTFPLTREDASRSKDRIYVPQRFDALLMPTASRWFDVYVSLWGIARGERGQLFPEAGFRLRLVSKEPPLAFPTWLARYVPMRGVRIGFRLPPFEQIFAKTSSVATTEQLQGTRGVRLVFEIGGGAY